MNELETIDLTPTWEGTIRQYMLILEGPANEKAKALVRADLMKLARYVDKRQAQEASA
ncbi:MAG: hypothetical protein ABGY29_03795 [bacterium]